MPDEASFSFAVACEDNGHFEAVARLVDRVLCERIDWLEPSILPRIRAFLGPQGERFWRLKDAVATARGIRLKPHGHFDGIPGSMDAAMIRAQLLVWVHHHGATAPLHVVFVARDTDGLDRATGARQAQAAAAWPFAVVLAHPHPEIEAWYIAGFSPGNAAERSRLDAVRDDLGFSPVEVPERLTSTSRSAKTDAKLVLRRLDGDDHERRGACLEAALDDLHDRGEACGLAAFLREVDAIVVPVVAGAPLHAVR